MRCRLRVPAFQLYVMVFWEPYRKGHLQGETLATPVTLGLDGNPEVGKEVRGQPLMEEPGRGASGSRTPGRRGAERTGPGPAPAPRPGTPPLAVLTLVAVTHGAEVHIVLVVGEEQEAEPGVEGVDGHDEEHADDVALLVGAAVAAQVHVDLEAEGPVSQRPDCHAARLPPFCSVREEPGRGDVPLCHLLVLTKLLNPEPQHPPR